MKIAVNAISKNEEQFVERFCASAKDADLILVADTGSTDATVAKLQACGAVVHTVTIKPWRFDLARNAALALLPADIDVVVSIDLDEELQPGWRQEIERLWKVGETTRMRYIYTWGPGVTFGYEKIFARCGYQWHHPCHEYPMPYGIPEVWVQSDMLLLVHHPDPTKSRGQYLPLLKMSVEEDPHCPRNAFYYARELSFYGKWEESIKQLDRYLALPNATWANERCYAWRVKGKCYAEMGLLDAAQSSFFMAASEDPSTREPWYELAFLAYKRSEWASCFAFAQRCLAITNRALNYTVDPIVWTGAPHDLAAIAAFNLKLYDIARVQGRLAVAGSPEDGRLKTNLGFYEKAGT